jgi:hypothetical protein
MEARNWFLIRVETVNQRKDPMTSDANTGRSLRDIELEVLEEGREWTRRRLEQRLQEEADRQGGIFPPQHEKGTSPAKAVDGTANRRRFGKTKRVARSRSGG